MGAVDPSDRSELARIAERARAAAAALRRPVALPGAASPEPPGRLGEAFAQRLALLAAGGGPAEGAEHLAQAALLLDALAEAARAEGRDREAAALQALQVPLALWGAAQGIPLRALAPLVNACAAMANRLREPEALRPLAEAMAALMEAADAQVRDTPEAARPGHPWRTLVVNRAIVATRTHDPALMESAFADLVRALPGAAAAFFVEGMREMDRLGYPHHVREVMARWHARHGGTGPH